MKKYWSKFENSNKQIQDGGRLLIDETIYFKRENRVSFRLLIKKYSQFFKNHDTSKITNDYCYWWNDWYGTRELGTFEYFVAIRKFKMAKLLKLITRFFSNSSRLLIDKCFPKFGNSNMADKYCNYTI